MRMKWLCAAVISMALAGCAIKIIEPTTGTDHAANPDAAEAPIPPRSETLALSDVPIASEAEDMSLMPEHGGGHDHASMSGAGHAHGAQHQPAQTKSGENAAVSAPRWTPTTVPTTTASAHICPMHKDVVSPEPGRCPKCGMKLVPVKPATQPAHTGHGGHQ
jgi:hypothetical protein